MKNSIKLLAIDPSLTQSGWALFSLDSQSVLSYGVLAGMPASMPLTVRLEDLQKRIKEVFLRFNIGSSDYLICEGPAPISLNPASSIKVEQVRGIFETLGREKGVFVLNRVNPRTLQHELFGISGKQLPRAEVKAIARKTCCSYYPELFRESPKIEQDAVDAILIGTLAKARLLQHLKLGMSLDSLFEKQGSARRKSHGRGMRWSENALQRR